MTRPGFPRTVCEFEIDQIWVKGEENTDRSFQKVALCSQPDWGTGGYLRGNNANHRSDNEEVMKP